MLDEAGAVDVLQPAGGADHLGDGGLVERGAVFKGDVEGQGAGEAAFVEGEGDAAEGDVEGWGGGGGHGGGERVGFCVGGGCGVVYVV